MQQSILTKNITAAKSGLLTLANPRILAIFILGFSSGLPIGLTGSLLQAWYTVAGVGIVSIGVLTLVGQPYVYKFLWAPLLDRYTPPFLGRRRGWIIITQLLLTVSIAGMAFLSPQATPWTLAFLALFVSISSATQDTAYNAYATDLLKPNERGLGASVLTTSYRIAALFSGGITLVMADKIGWQATYLIMAALMTLEMIATYFGPEPQTIVNTPTSLTQAVVEPFKEFLSRRYAIAILLFIVLYKLSDAFALSLTTSFLIRGLGFSLTDVGIIYKGVGLVAMLLGAFAGGFCMSRISLYRALLLFGILQGLSNAMFMILAIVGKNFTFMAISIFIESFCSGLGTVAFLACLMGICDVRYTATQFALLSALAAIGRVFVGPFAGTMVEHLGWTQFFLWSVLLAVPGLLLLVWLKNRVDFNAQRII